MRIGLPVLAGALAFMLLSACAGSSDPSKIAFPDNASQGLILMHVELASVPYTLQLASYDPNEQSIDVNSFGASVQIQVQPGSIPYLAKTVPPGTYVIQDLSQQMSWAVCFHKASYSFTIHPGEALFLGDLHARIHLAQLERLAHAGNNLVATRSSIFHYFDDIVPPQITHPIATSPDFLQAQRYETASMPALHGRLQPVVYQPAKFGTGYTLLGDRVCGGYFKEKLKQGQ